MRRGEEPALERQPGLDHLLGDVRAVHQVLVEEEGVARVEGGHDLAGVACDLRDVLPPIVIDALRHGLPQLDRRWQGRFLPEAVLTGPESRGSSPVRIDRDPHSRESPGLPGLYPVGEGAGYAGGIARKQALLELEQPGLF